MKKFKYLLIIVLFSIKTISYGLKSDYYQPMEIESDSGSVNLKNKNMEIVGNVFVKQGSLKIKGNKIILQKKNDKNNIINIYGNPCYFEQTLDNKNKTGNNQIFKGNANQINYNTKNGIITLLGKAKVQIDKNQIFGNTIIYNVISENFNVEKKVNIIIYPDDN